jgi:hypothetical protein
MKRTSSSVDELENDKRRLKPRVSMLPTVLPTVDASEEEEEKQKHVENILIRELKKLESTFKHELPLTIPEWEALNFVVLLDIEKWSILRKKIENDVPENIIYIIEVLRTENITVKKE